MVRTNDDDVELETALQELVLNLLGDGVEADVRVGTNLLSSGHGGSERGEDGEDENDGEEMEVDDNKALSAETPKFPLKTVHSIGTYWEVSIF